LPRFTPVVVDAQPRVGETGQRRPGVRSVAAVVDEDELDVAQVRDVEHPLDGGGHGGRLVVDGHQDESFT